MISKIVMVSAIAGALAAPVMGQTQTIFQRWVSEDVFWIISDQERLEFNRLQTDEARAQFIEDFWIRRDPTPGTAVNELRVEHYRRIAYANDQFAAPDKGWPGWKTDRGMTYIKFGAPDERAENAGGPGVRDSREGGGPTEFFPYERWRYRYLEGVGQDVVLEFVDRERSNEYRLAWDPAEKDARLRSPAAGQARESLIQKLNGFR